MKDLLSLIKETVPDGMTKRERALRSLVLREPSYSDRALAQILWPNDRHRIEYLRQTKLALFRHVDRVIYESESTSAYHRQYLNCLKTYLSIQILDSKAEYQEMLFFAEKLVKKAVRYEVTEVAIGTADVLFRYYGSVKGSWTKAKKFQKIIETQEALQLAERRAQRRYVELVAHFARSRHGQSDTLALAQQYVRELEPQLADYPSFRYCYYTYLVLSIEAELRSDKTELVQICHEALRFFQGKTYPIPNTVLFHFGFSRQVNLAIQTKDYPFARRAVQAGLELMQHSDFNSSVCLIYQAMIGFHAEDDELVRQAIAASQRYRNFANLAEQWRIIDAFAHFLEIEKQKPFRLGKFLNEVPLFSQDKQGLNITILVIQALFYIKRRQFGTLIDRWEGLQKYATRYLKKDHTFRSACFINMILVLPKCDFHPTAVLRHAEPHWQKLLTCPERNDVEIVPYERLWRVILSCLEQHQWA